MAKTESTAVTRLIELAQQRSPDGDMDWFAPPRPRRIAREEVTQVVRIARRALRVSPGAVLGAFLAGMLTVIVTTLVLRPPTGDPAPARVATRAPAPAPAPVVIPLPPEPPPPAPVAIPAPPPPPEAIEEPPPAAPTPAPVPPPVALERKPRTRTRPAPPKPTPDTGALAELRVGSKPPCELYIDGRKIGWTPQRGIAVAPGRHTVLFRNREAGVERKVIVDAKVGQRLTVIRDFTEP